MRAVYFRLLCALGRFKLIIATFRKKLEIGTFQRLILLIQRACHSNVCNIYLIASFWNDRHLNFEGVEVSQFCRRGCSGRIRIVVWVTSMSNRKVTSGVPRVVCPGRGPASGCLRRGTRHFGVRAGRGQYFRPSMTCMVMGLTVVMTGVTSRTQIARIIIGGGAVTVSIVLWLLVCWSLATLFCFYPLILEPDLDLALRQIKVSRQLKTFLFCYVGIKQEFFCQL